MTNDERRTCTLRALKTKAPRRRFLSVPEGFVALIMSLTDYVFNCDGGRRPPELRILYHSDGAVSMLYADFQPFSNQACLEQGRFMLLEMGGVQ
jgi:hypothetical protein